MLHNCYEPVHVTIGVHTLTLLVHVHMRHALSIQHHSVHLMITGCEEDSVTAQSSKGGGEAVWASSECSQEGN